MSFSIPFEFHKGDRLDDMTFIKPVARGGNGDLYLVRDDNENILALKVIRKTDNDAERNGIEQCRAVSSHIPGLVPILRTGKFADGRFYCVMPPADNMVQWPEYKPDTLAGRIRRNGRIPPDEVLGIAGDILTTIKALHNAGLAHCDIKPENILFIEGRPMLSDYSLLSDTAEHPASVPLAAVGTIGFVPPEMMEYPGSYNPMASDLYALGKIVYCAWTGADVIMFPSVPRDVDLNEIGIMRPLYMKACSVTPNGRFKNADDFIAAVSDARSRLNHALTTRVQSNFRKNLPVLLFVLLIFLCVIGLVNILFLLRIQSDKKKQEQEAVPGNGLSFVVLDDDKTNEKKTVPLDPLIVTTASDVIDPNDGVNSLREAFTYAQTHGAGAMVSFMGDYEIRLSSSLSVTQNIVFDGGENRITLIGPETEPIFQITESKLTLKNMFLISDRSDVGGGILDGKTIGRVDLFSVTDGGKAEWLWVVSDKLDMNLEDGSHLHRVQVKPGSNGGNIRIMTGAVLEDLDYTGDSRNIGAGNCDVNGLLKNAVVSDVGDIYVNPGGTAENITVKKGGFLDLRPNGKINGVKVEFGGVMGYMNDGIMTGTISIGGVAWEPSDPSLPLPKVDDMLQAFPVIDDQKTDIVFDLTERTKESLSRFNCRVEVTFAASNNKVEGPGDITKFLFNDIDSFIGAHGYTVRVRSDQEPGIYTLGPRAEKYSGPTSLVIGDKVYPNALPLGKSFSSGNKVYTLSLGIVKSRFNSFMSDPSILSLIFTIEKKEDDGSK